MKITKLSCSYCDEYKAIHAPRNGCASCWIKYLRVSKQDKPTAGRRKRSPYDTGGKPL